jgi:hypothetical protein
MIGSGSFQQNRQEGEILVNRQLTQDTFRLLQADMSPIAGIQLHLSPVEYARLLTVLDGHDLEYSRKVHLLGIYTILTLAASRHMDCAPHHPDLTRNILDGDYLYSFYLQFAVKYRELDLVAYLAPSIKKMQIKRANGDFAEENLAASMEQFLTRERRQQGRTSKAI